MSVDPKVPDPVACPPEGVWDAVMTGGPLPSERDDPRRPVLTLIRGGKADDNA